MSGWKIVKKQGETPYSYIHNNSGEFTVGKSLCGGVPDDCSAFTEYSVTAKIEEDTTKFDGFEQRCGEIPKELSGISCNQDALVMWFNYDDNKSYNDILDNNSVFYIKNVDECRHVIISNNLRVGSQKFDTSAYTDSGFPDIVRTEHLCGFGSTVNGHPYDDKKYNDNTKYDGHKIKYAVSGDTIPTNTLVGNNELVELYFPHYSVSGDNETTVRNIADGAFSGNTRLSAVTFNNVENIGNSAFHDCIELEFVDWGHNACGVSKLKTIGNDAFNWCKANCIITPDSLESIGERAFFTQSTNFIKLNDGLKTIGAGAFGSRISQAHTAKTVTGSSLYIPNSVSSIGENAFANRIANIYWDIENENPLTSSNTPILFTLVPGIDVYIPLINNITKMDNLFQRFNVGVENIRFYINSNLLDEMRRRYPYCEFYDDLTWRDEHTGNWPYVRRTS